MKKQLFVLGGGGLLLTLLIISGVVNYLGSKTLVLDDVSLREVLEDDSLAIYVDDGTAGDDNDNKNYVEYEGDTFPAKADGYKYNADKTTCIDNNGNVTTNVSLYYNNDMIQISTSETVYCYIYFDLYTSNGDWCLANDITDNLGECAIVMDNYYNDVDSGKSAIEAKDPVDTSEIAPDITYNQVVTENQSVSISTATRWTLGTSISFSEETGMYTIQNTTYTTNTADGYYDGYYTCVSTLTSCSTAYRIVDYTVTEGTSSVTYKITEADIYTYSAGQTIDSTNGIYAAEDDTDISYYYRGSVQNNYVLFAGYYWRIVRINGDGSVRMIYAGTDAESVSDDQIGTSKFNSVSSDPTYVGYMYGTTSSTPVTQGSTANFTNISANTIYYFGTKYEEVGDGTFKLSGNIISGTFSGLFGSGGDYEDTITDYYTCFSTSEAGTCTLLMKLNAYNSSSTAVVYHISYASTSYEDTLTNSYNSTVKKAVDKWYEGNILGKYDDENEHLLSDYISTSATFCGDRSLYSTFTGAGYILTVTTRYSAYRRLTATYTPTLKCSQTSDLYSVDNGTLTYPIGLITADEVAFAGGKYNNVNTLFYLYTGSSYWTMTPDDFSYSYAVADVWFVTSDGNLYFNTYVESNRSVRPVINLSSSVKISKGTGSSSNPFVVTLD